MKTSQRRERWVGGTLLVFALALTGCSQPPRQAELSRGVPAATPAPAAAPKLAANKPAAPLKVGKVVRGKVQAPPGLLKPAPRRTSFLDGLLISPAYALSGFVAVGDVEVGVWEGDDLARPIGQPLYTTYTNDYGEYELILPPAYEPTPQVVVQVVDPYYPVRRLLTGLIGQDLTLATEAAVSLLVDEARPVEVDVRVIPPQRVETVYVTVERQLAPVAPVIIVDEAPREVRLSRVMKRLKHNLGPRSRPVVVINEILVERDEFRPLVVYRPQPVDDVFVVYDDDHWDDAVIVRTNRDRHRAVRFVLDRRISKHDLRRLGWHHGHGHDDYDDDDHDDDRRRLVIDHGDRDWWVAGRSHDRERDLPFFVHSGKDRERGVRFVDYPNERDGDARLVQYLEGRGRRAESGDRHLATRSADGRDRSRDAKARWAEFNRGRSRGSDGDGDRVERQRHQRGSSPVVRVAAERDRDRQARRTNGRDRARSARSSDGDQRGREARRAGRQSEGKSNREARGRDRSRAREARRSDEQRVRARHVKRSNDRSRSGEARRSNDRDRSRGLSRSSERSKSREAKRSGDRSRGREANRSRERSRSRDASRSGERSRSRDANRSGERGRNEASRSRERGREANRSRERSRGRDASRAGERSRNRDGSRSGDRGGRNRDERGGRERGEKR